MGFSRMEGFVYKIGVKVGNDLGIGLCWHWMSGRTEPYQHFRSRPKRPHLGLKLSKYQACICSLHIIIFCCGLDFLQSGSKRSFVEALSPDVGTIES